MSKPRHKPESGQRIVEHPTEDDADERPGRVISPEEVAREFLRDPRGAGQVSTETARPDRARRLPGGVATAAGLVGTVAILVVLAAVALYPNHPSAPARSAHGATSSTASSTTATTTTIPLPPIPSVTVQVLNAYGSGELATAAATTLKALGFGVSGIGSAPNPIAGGQPSELFYGPSGLPAAKTLAAWLNGIFTYVPRPSLTGNNLELWIANPLFTVKGFPLPKSPTTTTSTAA
jgi:hypothetical protein